MVARFSFGKGGVETIARHAHTCRSFVNIVKIVYFVAASHDIGLRREREREKKADNSNLIEELFRV